MNSSTSTDLGNDREIPSVGFEKSIHQRLLEGDPTATADLAEVYLPYLKSRLNQSYPSLPDENLVDDAIVDTILFRYAKRPEIYDPEKGRLTTYLYAIARNRLIDLIRQVDRIGKRAAELFAKNIEHSQPEKLPGALEWIPNASEEEAWRLIDQTFPDEKDRKILRLMLVEEERRSEVYAELLEITDLPIEEQRQEVKRHKDRLKKRIQRLRSEYT